MTKAAHHIEVYVEIGQTRTFAAALDWPGWCRSGRDEAAALQALFEYGPRYARALQHTQLGFQAPSEPAALVVVERQHGDTTTNFGAPSQALPRDTQPIDPEELKRWQTVLKACWQAFDRAVEAAAGHTLSKGPRGGGRDVSKIVEHVQGVDASYLASLGGKLAPGAKGDAGKLLEHTRRAILDTLVASAHGQIPAHGPRGGTRWTPRYFVRRLAWHELDHAWEIENRAE